MNIKNVDEKYSETKNSITPDVLYQYLILTILDKAGGGAATYRVMNEVKEMYGSHFSEKDLMDYEKTKEPRWKNYVRFARQHLIEQGYLKNNSPRAFWEITDKGRKKLKEWIEMIRQMKTYDAGDAPKQ